MSRRPDDFLVRFWSKVKPEPTSGCEIWIGGVTASGYGQFAARPMTMMRAHRIAYELTRGPIPHGLVLDHICRNTLCVNPRHLRAVTQRENVLSGSGLSAQNARRTHCVRGHEFTPENTDTQHGRKRRCRACGRDKARAATATRKAIGRCKRGHLMVGENMYAYHGRRCCRACRGVAVDVPRIA